MSVAVAGPGVGSALSRQSAARRHPQRDAAVLAHVIGNRAFRQVVARQPPMAPPNRQLGPGPQLPAGAQMVDLNKIEYTQPGISFSTRDGRSVGKMAAQMLKTGWDVTQPADIVKLSDARLVSLDHRRLWAADRAGLKQVSARVHAETEALSAETAKRFAIEGKGVPTGTNPVTNQPWKAGDRPKTWGDAIRFRSAVQDFGKAGKQGNIGYNPAVLPGGTGVRDPKFPAKGSKDPPMRVQPGPYNRDEPYSGGGTMIKSGNKRKTVPSGTVVEGSIGGPGKPPASPAPSGGGGPAKSPASPAPTGGGGPAKSPSVSGPSVTGGGGTVSPTFTAGQRITSAAVFAAMAANAVGNWVINRLNERDIKASLQSNEAMLQAEQASNPGQGFLIVSRFTGGADSGQGPTAAPRFQGLRWVRARTEAEARATLKDQDRTATYQYTWIPPMAPESDWAQAGLAMFANVSKMEFQRLGFAQIGGFKVKRRSYPANLREDAQKWAVGLRFHVLTPPSKVSYRGVRGGNETESLTLADRDVGDGRARAIMIDGTPIVPVIAADQQTAAFFRADAALGLDHSGVVREANIDDIRWLRPEQIEMVDGPFKRFIDITKKHPDWQKNMGFPKGNDPGDPDSLQWDRIKGQWVQKRKG